MKHFLLLSIVMLNSLCIIAQDEICDDLKFIISKPELMEYEIDVTSQIENQTLTICNDSDSIYLKAVSNVDSTITIFPYTDVLSPMDSIVIVDGKTYSFQYKQDEGSEETILCAGLRLTINFKKSINVSFFDMNNDVLAKDIIHNMCVNDSLIIKAMPDVIDGNELKYQWNSLEPSQELQLYSDKADTLMPIFTVTDSSNCVLSNDTLVFSSIEPPKILTLDTIDASDCKSFGSVNFTVDNPYENFALDYDLLNIGSQTTIYTDGSTSISGLGIGDYELQVSYEELEGCATDTLFFISSADLLSLKIDIPEPSYCVGDSLIITSTTNDDTKNKYWYLKRPNDDDFMIDNNFNNSDTFRIKLSDEDAGTLSIKLEYSYNDDDCSNETFETTTIHSNPKPEINTSQSSRICPKEILELNVENSSYDSYIWSLNETPIDNETSNSIQFSNLSNRNYTYSVEVTNSFGCSGIDEGSVTVLSGIEESFSSETEGNLCDGSRILYYYNGEKLIVNSSNSIIENFYNYYYLVQWKDKGNLYDPNSSGNDCTDVRIDQLNKTKAPNGYLTPFGNSNTMVYADVDGTAENVDYNWFVIEKDTVMNFMDADERILDCNNFDCDVNSKNQVIGLLVKHQSTSCVNMFLYQKGDLLPVNENYQNTIFNLYPNLNQGTFFINLETPPNQNYKLAIYNALGKLIQLEQLNYKSTQQINMPNIEAGIYFAVLKQKDKAIAQQKLIIH